MKRQIRRLVMWIMGVDPKTIGLAKDIERELFAASQRTWAAQAKIETVTVFVTDYDTFRLKIERSYRKGAA